jgi:hypothetical protein
VQRTSSSHQLRGVVTVEGLHVCGNTGKVSQSISGIKGALGSNGVGAEPLGSAIKSNERSALTIDASIISANHNVIGSDLIAKVGWAGGQTSLGRACPGGFVHQFG